MLAGESSPLWGLSSPFGLKALSEESEERLLPIFNDESEDMLLLRLREFFPACAWGVLVASEDVRWRGLPFGCAVEA